ncbi:MAG: hypothetical protein WAV41_02500 [Microgenomates group bacterium]
MKNFDGVVEKGNKLIFYKIVAELPVARKVVEIIGSPKPRRQMRWKDGTFLNEQQVTDEMYMRKMGIA